MDTDNILVRIGYMGSLQPSFETLGALQRAFLESVPFENLDIHLNRQISLELTDIYEKMVVRRRGGFCYECNSLFALLLRDLGFRVDMVSARMVTPRGVSPEFDHMALIVHLDTAYLADVGNGRSCRDPMSLRGGVFSRNPEGFEYCVVPHEDAYALAFREGDDDWAARFLFDTEPRELADYLEMCVYHQTSPHSTFTQHRLASLALPDGRISLNDRKLTVQRNGRKEERELGSEDEVRACYREEFGIELD